MNTTTRLNQLNREAERSGDTPPRRKSATRPRPVRLTDRDLELLAFVAAHRFVHAAHVQAWLGTDRSIAYRRLTLLAGAGLLRYERVFHAQPGVFLISHGGLAVIDSPLPKPQIDLRTYRHELGAVWLWLAGRRGDHGSVERLWTEREMRHHDQTSDPVHDDRFGAPLGGCDRGGQPRVHYPDVLVISPDGSRVALELELSLKGRRRLEEILLAYTLDQRIERVVYVTDQPAVARKLELLGAGLQLDQRLVVRYFPAWENRQRLDMRWAGNITGRSES